MFRNIIENTKAGAQLNVNIASKWSSGTALSYTCGLQGGVFVGNYFGKPYDSSCTIDLLSVTQVEFTYSASATYGGYPCAVSGISDTHNNDFTLYDRVRFHMSSSNLYIQFSNDGSNWTTKSTISGLNKGSASVSVVATTTKVKVTAGGTSQTVTLPTASSYTNNMHAHVSYAWETICNGDWAASTNGMSLPTTIKQTIF